MPFQAVPACCRLHAISFMVHQSCVCIARLCRPGRTCWLMEGRSAGSDAPAPTCWCAGIFHECRAFDDADVVHVEDRVDPVEGEQFGLCLRLFRCLCNGQLLPRTQPLLLLVLALLALLWHCCGAVASLWRCWHFCGSPAFNP